MNTTDNHITPDNTSLILQLMRRENRFDAKRSDAAYKLLKQASNNNAEAIFAIKQEEVIEDMVLLIAMAAIDDHKSQKNKWDSLSVDIAKRYNRIVNACDIVYDYAYERNVTIAQARKDNPGSGFESLMDDVQDYPSR